MIKYFKRTLQDNTLKEIPSFEVGCWIEVVDPTDGELDFLAKNFNLNLKNLKSGLDSNELPRLEIVESVFYIFTKFISQQEPVEIETYLILIAKEFFLTFCKIQPEFEKKILTGKINFITTQKLRCLIKLFFLINRDFERATTKLVKSIERKKIGKEFSELEIENLLYQENALNELVSSYNYINLLYQRILRKIEFFEQDKEMIEDLIIEATQNLELCKSSLKMISNLRDYYNVLLSNRLNRNIAILTVFTILIGIIGAISGLFGMNIKLPGAENPYIFYYLFFFIGLIWVVFIFFLKKKKII